ncbi:MAG TPA: late competence development ComFB family protein [Candidatus Edwardsbacteria bacterium]|nr:late competence development ComFB family protein [Candidatus Edwardsbacteria bacterium]
MAKITNYMEFIVKEELKGVLASRPDVCPCHNCRLDIMAFALNQLPPHYVASEGGHIHTMVNIASAQLKTQVLVAIVNAINAVAKHPRHRVKKGLNTISRK